MEAYNSSDNCILKKDLVVNEIKNLSFALFVNSRGTWKRKICKVDYFDQETVDEPHSLWELKNRWRSETNVIKEGGPFLSPFLVSSSSSFYVIVFSLLTH